ncbi:MAG: hypothetical protein WD648_07930 [Planctomycetaceae bacterium]
MPKRRKFAAFAVSGLFLSLFGIFAYSLQPPAEPDTLPDSAGNPTAVPAEKPPAENPPKQLPPEFSMDQFTLKSTRDAEAKIREAMQKRMPADVAEVPLGEFVKQVAEVGNINVVLDEKRILDAGGDPAEKITANTKNATIETALNRVLPRLSLEWLIDYEALTITTESLSYENPVTKVYNLQPLRQLLGENPTRFEPIEVPVQYGPGRRRSGGEGYFSDAVSAELKTEQSSQKRTTPKQDLFQGGHAAAFDNDAVQVHYFDLADSLENELLEVYAWHENSAPVFSSLEHGNLMVVRTTRRIYEDIESFLNALELVIADRAPKAVIPVRPKMYPVVEDAEIRRSLQRKLSVNYSDTPLRDAIVALAKQTNVPFWLDEKSILEAGGDPQELITHRGVDETLYAVLMRILTPPNLSYLVDQGEIVVTTSARAFEKRAVVVYDVADLTPPGGDMGRLLDMLADIMPGPWGNEQASAESPFAGVVAVRTSEVSQQDIARLLEDLRREKEKNVDNAKGKQGKDTSQQLVTYFYPVAGESAIVEALAVIPQFVAPETWDEKAGRTIRKVGQVLVVKQTRRVQGEVQNFLSAYGREVKNLAEETNKKKP